MRKSHLSWYLHGCYANLQINYKSVATLHASNRFYKERERANRHQTALHQQHAYVKLCHLCGKFLQSWRRNTTSKRMVPARALLWAPIFMGNFDVLNLLYFKVCTYGIFTAHQQSQSCAPFVHYICRNWLSILAIVSVLSFSIVFVYAVIKQPDNISRGLN